MKGSKKLISLLLAVIMLVGLFPAVSFAAGHDNQVRVIVENTTWSKQDGAPWDGVLVDTWVHIDDGSTMMSAFTDALDTIGATQRGAESNYITEINGLAAMDGGSMSGWMGTLNDWFTNEGFGAFSVAAGTLAEGDEIRISHTMNFGTDLGGLWGDNTKTLTAIGCNVGTLSPAFAADTKQYTLTVPEGTTGVIITPTAYNKNFQVRASVGQTEYKRTAAIPVENGTVISVKCGDPSWPSMNNQAGGTGADTPAEVYTMTVAVEASANTAPGLKEGVAASKNERILAGHAFALDLSAIFEDEDADVLSYKVSINGADAVSADVNYSYTPENAGETTLVFTANDGKVDSQDTYTVCLTSVEPQTVTVSLSAQQQNTFLLTPQEVEITAGCAEKYGFASQAELGKATTLDALVVAHEKLFGELFTKENASDYLVVSSSGMITKMFGTETSAVSFAVNGLAPNDGVLNDYNSYTGYMVSEAELSQNDVVEFFFYQDSYYLDNYAWYEKDGNKVSEISAYAGEDIALTLKGYCYMYGYYPESVIAQHTMPMADLSVITLDQYGTPDGMIDTLTDDNGNATLHFDTPGKYILSASGNEYNYIFAPFIVIDVQKRPSVTADDIVANEINEDGSKGAAVTLVFDKETSTFSGALSPYTSMAQYNPVGVEVELTNLPDGAAAKLVAGDKAYAFADGKATTGIDKPFKYAGAKGTPVQYDCSIVVTSGEEREVFPLRLYKTNTLGVLTKCVLKGDREFDTVIAGQQEGTVFQVDDQGNKTGGYGLSPECFRYHIYVSSDTTEIKPQNTLDFYGSMAGQASIYVNGEDFILNTPSLMSLAMKFKNKPIALDNRLTTFELVVNSKTDSTQQIKYQFTIEKIDINEAEFPAIDSAEIIDPVEYSGDEFDALNGTHAYLFPYTAQSVTIELTAKDDIKLYAGVVSEETLLQKQAGGKYTYTQEINNSGNFATDTIKIIAVKSINDLVEYQSPYCFKIDYENDALLKQANVIAPDKFEGETFKPEVFENSYMVDTSVSQVSMAFDPEDGVVIYHDSVADENIIKKDSDGKYLYTFHTNPNGDFLGYGQKIIAAKTVEQGTMFNTYTFAFTYKGADLDYPADAWLYDTDGNQNELTGKQKNQLRSGITGWKYYVQLGTFGSNIVAKYDKPIMDDPKNPHGIDFIIYGNAFGYSNGSSGEPSGISVSEDGHTWYTLAGSNHYEDTTDWAREYGSSGLTSLLLAKSGENGVTSSAPPVSFGYADIHKCSEIQYAEGRYSVTGVAGNPYASSHENNVGDGFDLAWAVDDNGNPVELENGISYIKIQNVIDINHPSFGLCNSEIGTITRAVNNDAVVGDTSAPSSITIDGEKVKLQDGIYEYDAVAKDDFAVTVDVPDGTNVVINKTHSRSASYDRIPTHNKLRIIVQEGQKEPLIYYITLVDEWPNHIPARKEGVGASVNAEIFQQKTYSLHLSKIFEDKDGDALSYKVAVNGKESVSANEEYRFTPAQTGQYTLVFTANDAKKDSAETYTVTLTVMNPSEIYTSTGAYLHNTVKSPMVSSTGGEWAVIGLARSGYKVDDDYYGKYVANVINDLRANDGILHEKKYTEYSRAVLALTAIGYDVTNVAGYNLLKPLANYDKVVWQGINGPIWALIALNSHHYDIPAVTGGKTQTTRQKLISAILDAELPGGGWTIYGGTADTDMTAMALTSIAPYYRSDANVKAAVDRALAKLMTMQNDKGGFGSVDGANLESCAQVAVALTALGIDPTKDSRFIKNGTTIIDKINEFYVEGGGFKHVMSGGRDGMATEQGYYALAAYYRLVQSQTFLYDMTDVQIANAVNIVEQLIGAIGTVDAHSARTIEAARAAYEALTADQKAAVHNYGALTQAEADYQAVAEKINTVKALIDKIGAVKADADSKNEIDAARAAYDKLSGTEREYVTNYGVLTAAEIRYGQLMNARKVIDLIDAIGSVTQDSESDIRAARKAYEALSAQEKALVANYATLTAAERKLKALDPEGKTKIIGNGDTKVELNGVTYMVDKDAAQLMQTIAAMANTDELDQQGVLDAYKAYSGMSDSLKTQIFNFADMEALTNRMGVINHQDAETGMQAEGLDWYVQLKVKKVNQSDEVYEKLSKGIGSNTLVMLFDINLMDLLADQEIEPTGEITIRVPAPDLSGYDSVAIAHYLDDGRIDYLDCTIENGELIWKTPSFSHFAIIGGAAESSLVLDTEEKEAVSAVSTEPAQNSMLWLWIVLFGIGVAGIVLTVWLKKGKGHISKS